MILVIFAHLLLKVLSQQCQEGQVVIQGLCVQNDVSPLDSYAYFQSEFIILKFSFAFPANDTDPFITMMIQTNTASWFTFGLGPEYVHADIWAFQISSSEIVSQDCFGQNDTNPSFDVDFAGGQDNLVLLGYSYDVEGVTTVKFKRLLNTNDKFDQVINQTWHQPAMLAFGRPGDHHVDFEQCSFAFFSFPFIEGQETYIQVIDWALYHALINFICWGILVDFGIIMARYLKTYSWYMDAHAVLMVIIVGTSLYAELLKIYEDREMYLLDQFKQVDLFAKIHLILGTIITAIIFLQLGTGIILRRQILNKASFFYYLLAHKKIHQYLGMTLYFMAKITLLTGARIAWAEHSWATFLIYGTMGFTLVWLSIFEIVYQHFETGFTKMLNLGNKQQSYTSLDGIYSSTTNMIQHITQLDFQAISQEFPGKKWALFNNNVIDLSNHVHPGGQYLWEQCQGRELSRFIYGAYALESTDIRPYIHSEYAIKLIEKLTIGTLLIVPVFSEVQSTFQTWVISNQFYLTPTVKMFGLTKQGVTFITALNGFENFGRYFLVRPTHNKDISTRPYTMVLCMAKCNQWFRTQMIKMALHRLDYIDTKNDYKVENKAVYVEENDEFPLIIKRYESKTGFSQFVHSSMIGDSIELSGPFGTSFGMHHHEPGLIVMFAGGTGILPFLDFLDFLLKKTLHSLLKPFGMQEDVNPTHINFDSYFEHNNKFVLVIAAASLSEIVGGDIYVTLALLQKYLNQPNFELIINFSDNSNLEGATCVYKQRFDHTFIKRYIPDFLNAQRFLICGSPTMNKAIPESLTGMGFGQDKIHLV